MGIDWEKTVTFMFSAGAMLISIIAIIMAKKNLRKQLRLNKLEEILEILSYLKGYYEAMFKIFIGIEESIKALQKSGEVPSVLLEVKKYRKKFVETIDKETITNKISRLKVLSNAYLSNSNSLEGMKVKIHTIANIYYHMYLFVFMEGNSNIIKKEEDAIIPRPDKMGRFITKIEAKIIHKMRLGVRMMDEQLQIEYFKTKFKEEIED